MKRIAGIVHLDRTPVDEELLQRMVRQLDPESRGKCQTWTAGPVGMACVQTGSSPDCGSAGLDGESPAVITFDGRIDNRLELQSILKSELSLSPSPFFDHRLVSAAYQKWGCECVQYLVGDFAFAIWDTRRQSLFCARDHFGVKPFYYAASKDAFVFASTPNAVIASKMISNQINDGRIADFLVNPLEGIDKTSTFFEQVQRLPPAHSVIVRPEGAAQRCYWTLSTASLPGGHNEAELLEKFTEIFTEAVRCRLQSGPDTATMLSGGMDSASITAFANQVLSQTKTNSLTTISVVSDANLANRETSSIQACIRHIHPQAHILSEAHFLDRMDDLLGAIETEEEPFDVLMNLNRMVYLCARDQHCGVVLDGIDGDVLLSGAHTIRGLWRSGAIKDALGETLGVGGLIGSYEPRLKLFLSSLRAAFVPDCMRRMRRWMRYQLFSKQEKHRVYQDALAESIINPEFARQISISDRLEKFSTQYSTPGTASQTAAHASALNHPFLTVGLERYQRVASSFGVEAAHPLVDMRLVCFCLGLPWHQKSQRGWTKLILRKACEPLLPPQITWRKDKDSLMWYYNFLFLKEKGSYFIQLIQDEKETIAPYVDYPKLSGYCEAFLTQKSEKHAEHIWNAVALILWLRQQKKLVTTQAYG